MRKFFKLIEVPPKELSIGDIFVIIDTPEGPERMKTIYRCASKPKVNDDGYVQLDCQKVNIK